MVFSVIGWTIIHSLWQCLALAAALKLFLGLIDIRKSETRYAVALGVLGMSVVCVVATFVWEWRVFEPAAFSPGIVGGGRAAGSMTTASGAVPAGGDRNGLGPLWWLTAACPYLTVGWVTGVVFYSARLVLGGIQLRRLRRSKGVSDAVIEAMVEGLRMRMRFVRPFQLLITDRVAEPMAFGIWRAVVLVPLSYVGQVPAEQLELILAHEMAHIRRCDYVINLVQHVFDGLLFFNPFYRMVSAAVREEREYCCDDLAAVVAGGRRKMAVALTNLGLAKRGIALGLSAVPARRSLYRRVSRLIEPQERTAVSVRAFLAGLLLAVALAVGLTQCSRSVLAQSALPSSQDRMKEVLVDHQAGYQEQVFHYDKGGQEHELFLVKESDEYHIHFAYLDGERLNQGELGDLMEVLKQTRNTMAVVTVRGKLRELRVDGMKQRLYLADSIERQIHVKELSGSDSTGLIKLRNGLIQEEVKEAMDRYTQDIKRIPLEVEQHELLTRIVTNNAYTAADRRQLNDLIQRRQQVDVRVSLRP